MMLNERCPGKKESLDMFGWALTFLLIALIAAALGFAGIAGAAASIAKLIFVVALVLLGLPLLVNMAVGRRPPA
jgi:uncharacterized membrane protein YtjA (UPF0391 family)